MLSGSAPRKAFLIKELLCNSLSFPIFSEPYSKTIFSNSLEKDLIFPFSQSYKIPSNLFILSLVDSVKEENYMKFKGSQFWKLKDSIINLIRCFGQLWRSD